MTAFINFFQWFSTRCFHPRRGDRHDDEDSDDEDSDEAAWGQFVVIDLNL